MPGADASQYTSFKKYSANQRGDTQTTDPKSVNRLTQYIPRVSNVLNLGGFLPSLTKTITTGPPAGEMTFTSTATDVTFYLTFSATPTSHPIVTGGNKVSFGDTVGVPGVYAFVIDSLSSDCKVSGLENLTALDCSNNSLTSLDVSGLENLTALDCFDNSLTSLDVSGLENLTALNCSDNSLTSLNVSGLTSLTKLNCSDNLIDSANANKILDALPTVISGSGRCNIKTQSNGVTLNNLHDISAKNWLVR